ncbi:MAG: hypothetical protein UV38_C0002G0062 [candidate division TM6 bacterium GW2011_GWE2_42_60]|nr:MAG: hypothetical protein UV38_C0002G0062 [candidate division TM6 bacterium GW2011_GWE2_42_60]HBY06182.1 hypothetical protein [Candidatus Dependentiae bacterium]
MNKKYILFALAFFACFGSLKDINAGEDGICKLNESATTEDLIKLIQDKGAQIVKLDLFKCKNIDFTHQDINWTHCKNLRSLNLYETKITDRGLQSILTNNKNLKELILARCRALAFDKDLDWKNCEALEKLSLESTNITTEGLKNILTDCPSLKNLDLFTCINLDFAKLNLSKCERLDLSYTNITTDDLNKIIVSCQKLRYLLLYGCEKISFEEINWNKCANLEELTISSTMITNTGLNRILTGCLNLKILNPSECKNLNFEAIKLSNCTQLISLNLSFTKITPEGLKNILTCCPHLTTLDLFSCNKLDEKYRHCYKTKEAIEELKKDLGIENQKSLSTNPIAPKNSEQPTNPQDVPKKTKNPSDKKEIKYKPIGEKTGEKETKIHQKNRVETPFSGWVASAAFVWAPAIVAASNRNNTTATAFFTMASQLGAQAYFPSIFRSEDPGVSYRPASRIPFFRHGLTALSWIALVKNFTALPTAGKVFQVATCVGNFLMNGATVTDYGEDDDDEWPRFKAACYTSLATLGCCGGYGMFKFMKANPQFRVTKWLTRRKPSFTSVQGAIARIFHQASFCSHPVGA